MNLLEASALHTLATLHAGGPGSGRHATVQALEKSGFKRDIDPRVFRHPDNDSHRIEVSRDGSWKHIKGPSNNREALNSGKNVDDGLDETMQDIKEKEI